MDVFVHPRHICCKVVSTGHCARHAGYFVDDNSLEVPVIEMLAVLWQNQTKTITPKYIFANYGEYNERNKQDSVIENKWRGIGSESNEEYRGVSGSQGKHSIKKKKKLV